MPVPRGSRSPIRLNTVPINHSFAAAPGQPDRVRMERAESLPSGRLPAPNDTDYTHSIARRLEAHFAALGLVAHLVDLDDVLVARREPWGEDDLELVGAFLLGPQFAEDVHEPSTGVAGDAV